MHDSLFSRFRSGFLGAALGELFLTQRSVGQPDAQSYLGSLSATQAMLAQVDRWLQPESKQGVDLLPDPSAVPHRLTEVALMVIPAALFYHDQPVPLQMILHQWATQTTLTDQAALSLRVIGQIVSLTLRNRLVPAQVIPQLVRDLDWLSSSTLMSPLDQVQTWIEQPTSLARVAQEFRQTSTRQDADRIPTDLSWLMALYSFLSTPDQVQLTLSRLAQLPGCQPGDAAFAACLSGLYNGLTGIPLYWQQQIWTSASASNIPSDLDLFRWADQLLAVWSGTSHLQQWFQLPQHANLIAAPRTIRK